MSSPHRCAQWLRLASLAAVVGCARPSPPPPIPRVPPDADAVVVAPTLHGAVSLAAVAARAQGNDAGILRLLTESGLEAAGVQAPVVVAHRGPGGTLIAAALVDPVRFQAALAVALRDAGFTQRRLLGKVDRLDASADGDDQPVLVRAADGVVWCALGVADPLATAALLEALGSGTVGDPVAGLLTAVDGDDGLPVRLTAPDWGPLKEVVRGPVQGTLRFDGGAGGAPTLAIRVPLSEAGGVWHRALSSSSPPSACAVEQGAALAVRLPPVPGLEKVEGLGDVVGEGGLAQPDSFEGRLVIAVHPPPPETPRLDDLSTLGSLVVLGVPRAEALPGLQATLAEAGTALHERPVGDRVVQEVVDPARPWRGLHVVASQEAFALAVGTASPVDRVAVGTTCPPSPGRLVTIHGPTAEVVLGRVSPRLALLQALGGKLTASVPGLSLLQRLDTLTVDAVSAPEASVDLTLRWTWRGADIPPAR